MIDVTLANFETEVIAASQTVPVLVDFWAPWCGPCKTLGPVLEKVEAAYAGRFKLVKVNTEEEQQLAQAFGIRSIPTCVLMVQGQPLDGFMGALPEGQIKAFLDKHLPSEDALQAQAHAEEAQQLAQAGDTQSAQARLADALAHDPGNDDLRFDYVKLLIGNGQLGEAAAALAPALAQIPLQLRFEALAQWLNALEFVATDARGHWPLDEFEQRISANKRDFDTRFAKSRLLIAQGDWEAAMEELLEIIMRDKKWADEAPRKTYVALLELLTPPKPKADAGATGKSAGGLELAGQLVPQQDPQAELVARYRRKLSMALN
ncbi:thioredoxin [Macromonas bipunctata]|uniref:thioredoxin n=1 Tax=Macromonas bipunctata TaxID=183670 RepID=UPI000C34A1D6|nr:thioredoxin [Macromonas bipunctata]